MVWKIKNKTTLGKYIIYLFSNDKKEEVELKYCLSADCGDWTAISNNFLFSFKDKQEMVLLLMEDLKLI